MLELAKKGARWLREYEGWWAGVNAPVIQEGKESPEMLRHLLHAKGTGAREVKEVCRRSFLTLFRDHFRWYPLFFLFFYANRVVGGSVYSVTLQDR